MKRRTSLPSATSQTWTPLSKSEAMIDLPSLEKTAPWMQLSLGLGAQTTHIGLDSPRGHREWHYAGWRPAAS